MSYPVKDIFLENLNQLKLAHYMFTDLENPVYSKNIYEKGTLQDTVMTDDTPVATKKLTVDHELTERRNQDLEVEEKPQEEPKTIPNEPERDYPEAGLLLLSRSRRKVVFDPEQRKYVMRLTHDTNLSLEDDA
eukprot:Platyproteum_vivax@DN8810_c0_g1_i1.p1